MNKKHLVAALLLVVTALIGFGCGDDYYLDPDETIIFENRTGINGLSCYIDDELKGAVNAGEDLWVVGGYEGERVLRAVGGGVDVSRVQQIDDGVILHWTLKR